MKHTKEPWSMRPYGRHFDLVDTKRNSIGTIYNEGEAQRVIATVNALAGYENPAAIRECVAALKALMTEIDSITYDSQLPPIAKAYVMGILKHYGTAAKTLASLNQTENEK